MRRIIFLLVSLFVLFIIFFDLKYGTIPHQAGHAVPANAIQTSVDTSYKTVTVKKGETVVSIVQTNQPLEEVIEDFEALNKGVKANEIQAGSTYKFPVYER
ncbi:LysM peptidoglycan-binding domain-containing protein [Bacillus sp. 179-C3.3 HS]|uniref:LysM peptidoglycan-binding domain-containing protein n=1 Tax=Bacillus sp. 179-C3.3 HS TaxID=3232162 RepID=UPI0039A237BA